MLSQIFPVGLSHLSFVLAIKDVSQTTAFRIGLVSPSKKSTWMTLATDMMASAPSDAVSVSSGGPGKVVTMPMLVPKNSTSWITLSIAPPPGFIALEPGTYEVYAADGEQSESIGSLAFFAATSQPLTEDRIQAIKADPRSSKYIRIKLTCAQCSTSFGYYCAIDGRSSSHTLREYIWHADAEGRANCQCGSLDFDTKYIRENLTNLLGAHQGDVSAAITDEPLYQKSLLEKIGTEFLKLINSNPHEEAVQQFLTANPVLLCTFSPKLIKYKAPVLTRHITDIVIVNHRSELVLVELERPNKRLLKKDGGVSAELEQPIKQVTDWLHEFDERRDAVLSCMDLSREEVSKVRSVVIMGRDRDYQAEALRKFRKRGYDRIEILTYDDLLQSFQNIVRTLPG